MKIKPALETLLPLVQRPSRYAGGETGIVLKENPSLRAGLCYPDLYEIGMGNLALQILYETVNTHPDFQAERVFAVWPDMEAKLKESGLPLYTLESYTPLNQLDVLAFTLPFELVFTNVLSVLELGGIPLFSKERNESHPIILGGGPVCANPEPLAPFFDAFLIGEGEEAFIEALKVIEASKKSGLSRLETLKKLAGVSGFYVPSFYEPEYEDNGFYIQNIKKNSHAPYPVKKRVEPDLDSILIPSKFPIPWTRPVHDKGMVELFRGCYHRCRFCQAGNYYKPVRERSPKRIQEGVRALFLNQGQREFSLLSLSSGDYSRLPELLEQLTQEWNENFVSFYLPSIKINSFNLDTLSGVSSVRKSGLTLAIEAGGEKIRNQINKEVSDEKLFEILRQAKQKGWNLAKLYFMIGMTENMEDEKQEIIALLLKLAGAFKGFQFHVSINVFIPKAQTPFQWKRLYPEVQAFNAMKEILAEVKKNKNLKISFSSSFGHFLEGFFARGSRKASETLLYAYQKGARFDGWTEQFQSEIWREALEQTRNHLDDQIFLAPLDFNKTLPWQMIETGASLEFLKTEHLRSEKGEASSGCQEACADYCGNCDETASNRKAPAVFSHERVPVLFKTSKEFKVTAGVVFSRPFPLNLVSQLEMLPYWEKIITRAGLPLIFTEGFNPHPRMEFGFSAPVGLESFYENFRFQIWQDLPEEEVLKRLSEHFPGEILKVKIFHGRPPSLQSVTVFQDLSLEKVFIRDENLLSFIKLKGKILSEDEKKLEFRLPFAEKIKILSEWCDIYKIKRLRCLNGDQKEVI